MLSELSELCAFKAGGGATLNLQSRCFRTWRFGRLSPAPKRMRDELTVCGPRDFFFFFVFVEERKRVACAGRRALVDGRLWKDATGVCVGKYVGRIQISFRGGRTRAERNGKDDGGAEKVFRGASARDIRGRAISPGRIQMKYVRMYRVLLLCTSQEAVRESGNLVSTSLTVARPAQIINESVDLRTIAPACRNLTRLRWRIAFFLCSL